MQHKGKSQNNSGVFVMKRLSDVLLFSQHASWKQVLLKKVREGFFNRGFDQKLGDIRGYSDCSSILLSQDGWMDVIASDRRTVSIWGRKTHMQKSMLFIYSLAFNRKVFAFHFSILDKVFKGFPQIKCNK